MDADQAELLALLRSLKQRMPLPQPSWHGYVPRMRACLADFERALANAERHPHVLDLIARSIEGELEEPFAGAEGTELAAAYERLGALPRPEGRHPFVDEILPALEAMEAALVAVSLHPPARESF
jgi:hypothetical protein